MQKETLDKLRRYIDLAAAQASFTVPPGFRRDGGREQLWQEFIEAVLVEDRVLDDARLDQAFIDLMEREAGGTL